MNECAGRSYLAVLVRRVLLFCAVCVVCAIPLTAQTAPPTVLFVGHLNTDCYPDTVCGYANGPRTYLPDVIVWGQAVAERPQPCDKDGTHGGHPKEARLLPKTSFVYPGWRELRGSVAFEQYNSNDSITDVILYLWGKSPHTGKDTSRALVVYGQLALDTLPVLMIGEIATQLQSTPFFAMDMRIGREFVAPDVRDISGRISYELPRVNFPLQEDKPPHPLTQAPVLKQQATVSVYPNPAELWTRLESSPLEQGDYTITVMAVNGRVYHTQSVTVAVEGQIERELNLNNLPSGYYVVQLHREGELISSYPIVIVH